MKTLKTLALIGLLAIFIAIVAGVFFFGGFYSVAGTADEPEVVKWALGKVRQASVVRHAKDLGSLAVFCLLVASGLFALYVVVKALL